MSEIKCLKFMNHIHMSGSFRFLELLVYQHTPLSYTNRGLPSLRPSQTGEVVSELASTVQHRRCGSLAGISSVETNEHHLNIL